MINNFPLVTEYFWEGNYFVFTITATVQIMHEA